MRWSVSEDAALQDGFGKRAGKRRARIQLSPPQHRLRSIWKNNCSREMGMGSTRNIRTNWLFNHRDDDRKNAFAAFDAAVLTIPYRMWVRVFILLTTVVRWRWLQRNRSGQFTMVDKNQP